MIGKNTRTEPWLLAQAAAPLRSRPWTLSECWGGGERRARLAHGIAKPRRITYGTQSLSLSLAILVSCRNTKKKRRSVPVSPLSPRGDNVQVPIEFAVPLLIVLLSFILIEIIISLFWNNYLQIINYDSNNDSNNSSSDSSTKSANTTSMSYVRSMRGRWLDVHVCYAFLLPAGISAGEHSSYWLVLAPAFMLYRFLFREDDRSEERENGGAKTGMFSRFSAISSFLSPAGRGLSTFVLIARRVHKYTKIVFASLALALLIVSGSATLHQSLTALNGGGMALRVLLSPFAIGVAFLGYFAPAALLPRYISNVFSRKITADEVNAPKAPLSEEERIKLEIKKESEKV